MAEAVVNQPLGQHYGRLTMGIRARPPVALAIGAAAGLVLGIVAVDGTLKIILACLGAIFLALSIVYPRLILYVLVVLVACFSETTYGVQAHGVFRLSSLILNPVRLNISEILIYSLFFILAARRSLGSMPRGVPGWITVSCLVSALLLLFQLGRALVAGTSYIDAVNPWNGQYILAAVVALWCFTELLGERLARLHLLDFLYVCATGRSVYALFSFVFDGGDTANAYRTSGVKVALWESADHLLFVFLITVAIAAWATGRVAGKRLAFWAAGSIPMALTVALSYRRTSWFGLAAALILVSVILVRRTERSLALVPAVLAVLAAIGAASYSRFRTGGGLLARLFPDLVSRVGPTRQQEWALAWHTIVRNPIAGDLMARRLASSFAFWDTAIVHNAFLFAWMKLGLAGLLSLCFLGATCVVYALQGVKARVSEEYISFGVLGVVPFVLALAMFETPLIELRTMLILALVGALAVRVACASDERDHEPNLEESPDDAGAKGD
jgi:O-antigen ligase